jgi:hypothetical protein
LESLLCNSLCYTEAMHWLPPLPGLLTPEL